MTTRCLTYTDTTFVNVNGCSLIKLMFTGSSLFKKCLSAFQEGAVGVFNLNMLRAAFLTRHLKFLQQSVFYGLEMIHIFSACFCIVFDSFQYILLYVYNALCVHANMSVYIKLPRSMKHPMTSGSFKCSQNIY